MAYRRRPPSLETGGALEHPHDIARAQRKGDTAASHQGTARAIKDCRVSLPEVIALISP
jgi:hypothetical protein